MNILLNAASHLCDLHFSSHWSSHNENFVVVTATASPGVPTKAPVFTQCDFETNGLCGWRQDNTDEFDWTIHQQSTGTDTTGPSYDHTTGNDKGPSHLCLSFSVVRLAISSFFTSNRCQGFAEIHIQYF